MSYENKHVEKVTDVIQVMKSGIEFYKDALDEVKSEEVKGVFRKIIANKEMAVESLQPLAISEQGEREEGGSAAVATRKLYTKFIGMMASDEDHTYVKQLEEVEDKVLETLDDALNEEQPAGALETLRKIRMDAQKMHDEMKTLQIATK